MIQELSYVGIGSPNFAEWHTYGTRVLGAMRAPDGPDGAVRLAVDDINYRIAVHPAARDEFRYAGWGLANETDLHSYRAQIESAGVRVHQGTREECTERQVAELLWFTDPWGQRHELSWGKAATPLSFVTGRPMRGRFVTGDQGLGHVVFGVPDLPEADAFYSGVLGFRLSDRIITDYATVRFYHVNGRHHSLALAELPGHIGFNHLMIEVEELDDLGRLIDLLAPHHVPTMQTLGRHTNDQMTSVYIGSPSSLQIEYGHGGLTVDELSWIGRTYTEPSYWGHRYTKAALSQLPGIVTPLGDPAPEPAAP